MNQTHICLICGYENEKDVLVCAKCGASLQESDPTPIMLTPLDESLIDETKNKLLKRPVLEGVTLHIAGKYQPIVINHTGTIIFGRNKGSPDDAQIDMNPYQGVALGVSRRHAALIITDEECTLEDLGSTNGTWLNELRLEANRQYPVRSGDLIRLGHLLIIVSFQQ